jgi:hypothetical protein
MENIMMSLAALPLSNEVSGLPTGLSPAIDSRASARIDLQYFNMI